MFTIFEILFLLAMNDAEGGLVESALENLEPALAGALLVELMLCGRIRIEDGRITVVVSAEAEMITTENSILDQALYRIQDTTRMRKIKYWINTLTYEKLHSDIEQSLVEKGVLTRKKKRLLLVVPFGPTSSGQVSAKFLLKNRLREIILAGLPASQSELVQLALLYPYDLLSLVFTRGERKAAEKRIKGLLSEDSPEAGLTEPLKQIIAVATRSAQ